jgi:hypothetical protein
MHYLGTLSNKFIVFRILKNKQLLFHPTAREMKKKIGCLSIPQTQED